VDGAVVGVGGIEYVGRTAPAAAADFRSEPPGDALRAYVTVNGAPAGVIEFADRPRAEAGAALARLRRLGIRPLLLLSGDTRSATEALGAALGLDEARGEQLPGDKLAAVAALRSAGERVLMVGDGVNDAPALSAADLGVALAAGGGGISAEAADVVVLNDDLNGVPEAVAIGRRTMRIARQSLWVGLGLSAIAMGFAAAGAIPPAVGAVLQEGIDVAVILNAIRASGEGTI
jgi:P-type E1-E2 ATPase